jgi:superfamily I DNA/RNA helicase
MCRIARLLQTGVAADRIFTCTFTRTAARDLQNELSRFNIENADRVYAGTLHSFCFHILSNESVLQTTGRIPRPMLDFEKRFLIEDLNEDSFGGIRARERRLKAFEAAWARLQTDEPGWATDPVDQVFQNELNNWLRFHCAMIIGEIVPETLRFLRYNPILADNYLFDYVLVDEYQDLNRAEQELINIIANHANFTIAGDKNQSIYYTLKYAHPEGIEDFCLTHPQTHDESLLECRRCPSIVVDMANSLISRNPGQNSNRLCPRPNNQNGEVLVVQWVSMEEEANGIARFIANRINDGDVTPGQVLILTPRRRIGYAIRNSLNNLGCQAHSFFQEEALEGNPKNPDRSNAQKAFTLLKLLANPEDRVALRCWCGFDSNSLCQGPWSRMREHCESIGQSPMTTLQQLMSDIIQIPRMDELISRYNDLQIRFRDLCNTDGQSFIDAIFPVSEDWAEPFRSIASTIPLDELNPNALYESLRVGITQPELPTDVDYIRVMSLHKSKGLSAELVVVAGCIEGLIPSIEDGLTELERTITMQEQRRLFYVAITRTTKILMLSSVTRIPRREAHPMRIRTQGGNRHYANTVSSSFLSELGPNCPRATLGRSILRSSGS